MLIHAQRGDTARALAEGREALDRGVMDFGMATTIFMLARDAGDAALAERAMKPRLQRWDVQRARGWLDLGQMYAKLGRREDAKAAFAQAVAAAQPAELKALLDAMPADLRPPTAQTSASKG